MDLQLTGRRALVTGATGGIGRATALLLAREGAEVTVSDTVAEHVAALAREIGGKGIAADLASEKGVAALVAEAGTSFDILVHACGVTGAKGDPLTMTEEDWSEALDTDFLSAVRLARHLGPAMTARGWGRMVFITSENAAQPYAEETVYNASKSALLSWAKSVSTAHAAEGLLANCVAPAFIETPMTDGMMDMRAEDLGVSRDEAIESFLKEERPFLSIGRRGQPEEVAPVIALLCSPLASFVSGANWRVDGGSVGSVEV